MIKKTALYTLVLALFSCLMVTKPGEAQPSAEQLAGQIEQKNSQRIANINTVSITIHPENGGYFPATTTTYFKVNEGGRDILVTVDADMDVGVLSGSFDDQMPKIIRAAHTITSGTLNNRSVYVVEIDDTDALNELGRDDSEYGFDDDEIVVNGATVWIDQAELYPLRMEMNQISAEGFEVTVNLGMEDYRTHDGLAIPHRIVMNIDGFQDQFTDEDMAMMEEYMREIEEQMNELSAEQREMMEEQLRPQLEQFEAMINGDFEMNEMVFVVTDVRVNE